MTVADSTALVVVDTNVLVAATDRSRRTHLAARDFLDLDPRQLAVGPQIVREYLAVATRPVDVNGLGLTHVHAVANVEQLLEDMPLLSEAASTSLLLLGLVQERGVLGKQVHDANVVALALSHGAGAIVTDNPRHFQRFADLVAIEDLGERHRT